MTRLLPILLLVFSSGELWAENTPAQDQSELIKSLVARIEMLEKQVADLKQKQTVPAASPQPDPAPAADAAQANVPEQPDANGEQPATVSEAHYPSLHFRGFGDVNFAATDAPASHSGFNLGQLALHLASPLSKKISFFGEISFTARPGGYNIELERSYIRYDYNDYFKLSFGRYHTPINYWNTAFHHGSWLQTSISRPDMIQFGGTFLPVHFVGLLAEGSIPSGGAGLGYNVGLGNGRAAIISRAGDAGDVNNDRAWVANIFARPARLDGLQVGASVYHDKVSPEGKPDFAELITSAHLVWTKEHPEFLAEFANVRHRQLGTSVVFNSQGFYLQLGYRLPGDARRWKPYYRYDYIFTPRHEVALPAPGVNPYTKEPVFGQLNIERSTLGVRYDISDFAAFKGEYRNTRRPGEPRVNGVFLQTSFTF